MYEKIPAFYDALGWNKYSIYAMDIVNNILLDNKVVPDSLCDLGCGTGEFITKLSDFYGNTRFVGIDLSEEMIKVAKKKCSLLENVKLYKSDMRKFKLEKRVNVITSMYDSVNHLLSKEDWNMMFTSSYDALKYGGVLIIDIVPLGGLKKYAGIHYDETKEGTLIRDITFDSQTNQITSKVNAFVKTNYFGTYKNIREEITETSFKLSEIARMLRKKGFKKISMYNMDLKKYIFNYGRLEKEERVYIVAHK